MGRPRLPEIERTTPRKINLSPAHWAEFERLGGARWLRGLLDGATAAPSPTPTELPTAAPEPSSIPSPIPAAIPGATAPPTASTSRPAFRFPDPPAKPKVPFRPNPGPISIAPKNPAPEDPARLAWDWQGSPHPHAEAGPMLVRLGLNWDDVQRRIDEEDVVTFRDDNRTITHYLNDAGVRSLVAVARHLDRDPKAIEEIYAWWDTVMVENPPRER